MLNTFLYIHSDSINLNFNIIYTYTNYNREVAVNFKLAQYLHVCT